MEGCCQDSAERAPRYHETMPPCVRLLRIVHFDLLCLRFGYTERANGEPNRTNFVPDLVKRLSSIRVSSSSQQTYYSTLSPWRNRKNAADAHPTGRSTHRTDKQDRRPRHWRELSACREAGAEMYRQRRWYGRPSIHPGDNSGKDRHYSQEPGACRAETENRAWGSTARPPSIHPCADPGTPAGTLPIPTSGPVQSRSDHRHDCRPAREATRPC